MLKLQHKILLFKNHNWTSIHRSISALYITGDKAKENYVTLQPYLDFKSTFQYSQQLQHSINKRKLPIDLENVISKYNNFQKLHGQLNAIEEAQNEVQTKLKELTKNKASVNECNDLKEHGRTLRNNVKQLKQTLYPIEDDFIHSFLNLPNTLHEQCPTDGVDRMVYRSPLLSSLEQLHIKSHAARSDLIKFVDGNHYYLLNEAAHFEVYSAQNFTRYLVETGNFIPSANPDFVRCVLLEASNATPMSNYHLVKEENLQNNLNVAYLTGGASFESFLGALTKLSIYPSVLPLRMVSCGRSYVKATEKSSLETDQPESLFTATQTNAVQTLVATKTASESDEQMEQILNLCVDFYKALGVPFRISYVDASALMPSECLRAQLEVYSPALKKYINVGHISNYGDFISKRILFNMRHEKSYIFPHLIGGPVLYTSRLIGALIENGLSLDVTTSMNTFLKQPEISIKESAIDEFKNIFK